MQILVLIPNKQKEEVSEMLKFLLMMCFSNFSFAGNTIDFQYCDNVLTQHPRLRKGALFTAIRFAEAPLGRKWKGLYQAAQEQFPGLHIKNPEDLHITVVHIGKNWSFSNLNNILAIATPPVQSEYKFTSHLVTMGRHQQVVALELTGDATSWAKQIVNSKAELVRTGLKSPDKYDQEVRLHITLGSIEKNGDKITTSDREQLQQFQYWAQRKLDLDSLEIALDQTNQVEAMLAGASRPNPEIDYISLQDYAAYLGSLSEQ